MNDHSRTPIEADEPNISDGAACRFEVYRADQVRLTATQFSGGDWRWRLLDKAGQILVEAGGYPSEEKCREAVAVLKRYAAPVSLKFAAPFGLSVREGRS